MKNNHRFINTMKNNQGFINSWVTLKDDTEVSVCCVWESTPPEPGVNWPGSFELIHVEPDVYSDVSDDEWEALARRVEEEVVGHYDLDAYGDHLYDLKKDEGL